MDIELRSIGEDEYEDWTRAAADLAATYLGTVPFTTLSRAGRVEERTPGALLKANAMFATGLEPWCPVEF